MRHFLRSLRRTENLFAELLRRRLPSATPQKVFIDYSSPNIAKHFHIGNLRSTLIGRFICSINRLSGNEVVAANYLGDWGSQFALLAAYWPLFKVPEEQWSSSSDSQKLDLLTQCYTQAYAFAGENEEFRAKSRDLLARVEHSAEGSEEFSRFWKSVSEISMRHLNRFYDDLKVHFDAVMRESDYFRAGNEFVDDLVAKGLASKMADGATVIRGPGIDKYALLRKSDNSSLYLSREVVAMLDREKKYSADVYLFVVDTTQAHHFVHLKALLNIIGRADLAAKVVHVPFGRVIGLSTRKGKTESANEIIAQGRDLAEKFVLESKTVKVNAEQAKDVAKQLSLSTVVVNDLKRHRTADYTFSFTNAFKMNQTNALLLQMKHSRLCSLERYNAELMRSIDEDWPFELELNDDSLPLVRHLQRLDDALLKAHLKFEPCQVTVFLVQLANHVGSAMAALRVANESREKALPRLLLFTAARRVLGDGMKMLGLEPLDEM